MKISRERLQSESEVTGFRPEVMEKVIQLLNLLDGFSRHPFIKDRLALKGGTALNLFVFDLPRLSVDIDLNYVGAADRETMMAERPKVEQAVEAVCLREGMTVARIPTDHAGGKWRLRYDSELGGGGNLNVDLNFLLRVPLWPVVKLNATVGSQAISGINVLDIHELAAGKLAALFSRNASRDLFDAHHLLTKAELNREKLRLGFVLYGAMNRKDWRAISIEDIGYDAHDLENELIPVVRSDFLTQRKSGTWADGMIEECRRELQVLMPMKPEEIAFLDKLLDHGQIEPELLTSDSGMIQRISTHPLLQWKAINVRQHKGR